MFKLLTKIVLVLFTIITTYYFVYFWVRLALIREFLPTIPWITNILSLCVALFAGLVIWKMTTNQRNGSIIVIGTGAIGVGSIGFIFGFFGPMIFVPESNLGPLLGLFITGPLGVFLGAFIGLIYWLVRVKSRKVTR